MFNTTTVKGLVGLVGWNQPSPAIVELSEKNLESRSGLLVNQVSQFARIDSLYNSLNTAYQSDADFNDALVALQEQAIIEAFRDVFDQADIIESKPLYSDITDRVLRLLTPSEQFRGVKVELINQSNIAATINGVWLSFDGDGEVKLLCFDQYRKAPIYNKTITVTGDGMQYVALGWELPFMGATVRPTYFIGYLGSAVTVSAIQYGRCENKYSNMCVESGRVDGHILEEVFVADKWQGGSDQGLNLDITVRKDYTAAAVNNQLALANAVAIKVAIKAIEAILATNRSNPSQRISDENITRLLFELEGNAELKVYGLRSKYEREIKNMKQSFTATNNKLTLASKI